MSTFDSAEAVLNFAIAREEEAIELYGDLALRAAEPASRALFRNFANEEKTHREKLLTLRGEGLSFPAGASVPDLRISDYLVDIQPSPDMDYRQVLVMAMKKEKASFKLYTRLAECVEGDLKCLLEGLAQEEARHKLQFELEYEGHGPVGG